MKKFEYFYFTIYNHNSRQSYFADSPEVRLKSLYMIALSVGGWILFLEQLFLRFVRNAWFSSHPVAMIYALGVFTIITFAFYRIFIVNEQDQRIFNKYSDSWNNNPNKKRDLFLVSLIAVAPYLFMLLMKMFFHR